MDSRAVFTVLPALRLASAVVGFTSSHSWAFLTEQTETTQHTEQPTEQAEQIEHQECERASGCPTRSESCLGSRKGDMSSSICGPCLRAMFTRLFNYYSSMYLSIAPFHSSSTHERRAGWVESSAAMPRCCEQLFEGFLLPGVLPARTAVVSRVGKSVSV